MDSADFLKPLISLEQLKWDLFYTRLQKKDFRVKAFFDPNFDCLDYFLLPPQIKFSALGVTIVHYLDEDMAIVFAEENYEILGFHIEAWQKTFRHKFPNFENSWHFNEKVSLKNTPFERDLWLAYKKEKEVQYWLVALRPSFNRVVPVPLLS